MGTEGDIAAQELFQVFRETIIRWLDRARHLTPGEGFELGALVSRLERELLAEEGGDLVARRMALIGEVQLSLADVHAPEALISAAGHLKGRLPAVSAPASGASGLRGGYGGTGRVSIHTACTSPPNNTHNDSKSSST